MAEPPIIAGPTPVRLEKIPIVPLPPARPPDAAETARIKDLIRQLAQIDRPDFGLSPTLFGTGFAPIPGSESAGAFMMTDHNLKSSPAFVELVRIGPRALPFLLEAIDDRTPTKLAIKALMWMEFSNEMAGSPANERERKILATLPGRKRDPSERDPSGSSTEHRVTIGDVCFVIIGQIVGRGYQAARYQPTAGVVVNSPTRDPDIARAVRAIWSSDDPTRHVLDCLLLDYATRGIHRGGKDTEFGDWSVGSTPQIPAAMRLLFYFPRQIAPIIARRLDGLQVYDVASTSGSGYSAQDMARWAKRELANEVTAREFIQAVSWCREPEVQASLLSLFRRAGDSGVLMAALPALDRSRHWPLVQQRFVPCLRRLPREEGGWYGDGYNILVALRDFGGEKARPLYRDYLKGASAERSFSVCMALEETKGEWDREFLWPMLSDKRRSKGYSHPLRQKADSPRLDIRVCDQAAEAIALHRKDVTFTMVGTKPELDRQIRQMQKRLLASPAPRGSSTPQ